MRGECYTLIVGILYEDVFEQKLRTPPHISRSRKQEEKGKHHGGNITFTS